MATVSLRERKKEQTRLDLVKAAVQLFNEQGYEDTTIDDIAERANFSRSTFFRYFSSKEEVVFGDISGSIEAMPRRLAALAADSGNAWKAVRELIIQDILDLVAFAPELEAECVALWFKEPGLLRRYTHSVLATEDVIAEFLGQAWGVDPDAVVAPRVAATAAVGVGRAAMRTHVSDKRAILEALNRGFDLLESGAGSQFDPENQEPGAAPRGRAETSRAKSR